SPYDAPPVSPRVSLTLANSHLLCADPNQTVSAPLQQSTLLLFAHTTGSCVVSATTHIRGSTAHDTNTGNMVFMSITAEPLRTGKALIQPFSPQSQINDSLV